ncbi:MAG: hypothetical protein B7C24_07995 [Bacteroidetes bacterium 4572_77]|nr:MAG: hypothetical protein B7C24_07995 [Bacteroidetes bacterium 4572_77]
MDNKNLIIETVGTISKKEDLVFFENPNSILAFETAHAYPGYNGVVPHSYDPNSLFFVCKERYLTEEIFRVSQTIKSSVSFAFDAAVASVDYQNKQYPAIRIKDIRNYSFIPELLQAYLDNGISFEKKKSLKEVNTLIRLTKAFHLQAVNENCYKDLNDEQMFYFAIPNQISWDEFEKHILDIKYNTSGMNFDAALALFYRAEKIVDAVRIYKQALTVEEVNIIKDKFLKLL